MSAPIKAVVFDIGNVLIRWDPHLAYLDDLGSHAAVDAFFARIGFTALNLRADAGERFADLATTLPDTVDARLLASYPERYAKAFAEPIEGTWALLDRLRRRGLGLHAITNFSAETWPVGLATHPRLGTAFGVTVVSGQERILKPEPAIFTLLCTRADLAPQDCIFIDDSEPNVAGARAVGMQALHFTTPAVLERDLAERGLL